MNILIISLSSTIQRTLLFSQFQENKVNRSKSYLEDASGKAVNTARVLSQLGFNKVETICSLGKENYKRFLSAAKKDNLKIIPFLIPGKTRECWTLVCENGDTTEIVCDEPSQNTDSEPYEKKLLKLIKKRCSSSKINLVMILGSCPAFYSRNLYAKIFHEASKNKVKTFADFHGETLKNIAMDDFPDFIKINEDEFLHTFCNASEFEKLSPDEKKLFLKNAIKEKSTEYNSSFIITRGKESTFACQDKKFYEVPTLEVKVKNTTACGDSFNAGFVCEYFSSADFYKALMKGSECAALNAANYRPGSII